MKLQSYKSLFLCILLFFAYSLCHGEGTAEIRPTSGNFGYLQVWDNGDPNRFFATYNADSFSRLYIHIEDPANEVIYFGFGLKLFGPSNVYYRLRDPNGNIVIGPALLPTAGAGYINNYNDAVNGPSQLTGSGYTGISYTPAMAGDYYIEFNPSSPTTVNMIKTVWREFDITVGHTPTSSPLEGRVFSMNWDMTTNGSTNQFYGQFYILTNDSIVTRLNPNGFMPFGFTVTTNRNGTSNTGDFAVDRKSITSFSYFPEYKIFLNEPDSLIYPTGRAAQITASSPNSFVCDTVICIDLEFSKDGQIQIVLELNGTPGYQAGTEDVRILTFINNNQVCIPWDGVDGLGNPISTNTPVSISVTIVSGLTNFPIFDAECNPDGFIVDAIRPNLAQPRLYYDDTDLGGGENTATGCASPCHSWGNQSCSSPVGNNVMVNTYWFATLKRQSFISIYPNCPPVAIQDMATVQSGGVVTVPVVNNDQDPNNNIDPTTVSVPASFAPSWGSIDNIDPVTGAITYSAPMGFSGTDVFSYVICDDLGTCDTGLVIINVACSGPPVGLEINGYVFYDYFPSNGIRDPSDAGIGAAVVNVFADINQNGVPDAPPDMLVATQVTDADGFFSYQAMNSQMDFSRRVSAGNDDAEEDFGGNNLGNVNRNSNDLDLGYGYTNPSSPTFTGIRFQNVQIPQGVLIDSASITFRARSSETGNCDLFFFCENVNDASSYANNSFDISTRNYTSNTADWIDVPNWYNNNYYTTPNLASIVQTVINRPGWSSGNALAFGVVGTDRREADSYNGSSSDAPLLFIRYGSFNLHYVLEIDTSSVPQPDYDLTTTNIHPIVFSSMPAADCGNDFGFFNRLGFWPLPLNITEFNARLHPNRIAELKWQVSTELNTIAYEVEKAADAESFELMERVEVNTSLAEPNTYVLYDDDPYEGYTYYRIASIDPDGEKFYTDIRNVYLEDNLFEVSMYPNYLRKGEKLHFYLSKPIEDEVFIEIFDMKGSRLQTVKIPAGSNDFSLNPDFFESGVFLLSISSSSFRELKKIIVH